GRPGRVDGKFVHVQAVDEGRRARPRPFPSTLRLSSQVAYGMDASAPLVARSLPALAAGDVVSRPVAGCPARRRPVLSARSPDQRKASLGRPPLLGGLSRQPLRSR